MRFDDMLATVLARAPERVSAVSAQWRQLIDLLAQRNGVDENELGRAALARLEVLRPQVPVEVRRDAAAAVAHAPMPPALFMLLADDEPMVANALIAHAPLSDAQWLDLIPRLGPTGRGLLRHRRDLGPAATAALQAHGAGDLLLSGTTSPEAIVIEASPEIPGIAPEAEAPLVGAAEASGPEVADSDAAVSPDAEVAASDATGAFEPDVAPAPEPEPADRHDAAAEPRSDMPREPEDAVFEEWFEQIALAAPAETLAAPRPASPTQAHAEESADPPAIEFGEDATVAAYGADDTRPQGAAAETPPPADRDQAEPIATVEAAAAADRPEPSPPAVEPFVADGRPAADRHARDVAPIVPDGRVVSLFGIVHEEEQQELPLSGGEEGIGPFSPDAGHGQIRSIISRIAHFRSGEGFSGPHGDPVTRFAFETDRTGTVRYVDAGPRGALVGETIASAAAGPYGVDGQAAGAFRKRGPFRDARLVVAGEGELSGEWRIAGVPAFASADGRFLGYRCTARRPLGHERAEPTAPVAADLANQRGDTLRQIVHELRTPLNAIGGFAEMIRRQMRGPVAEPYRDRARDIADQSARLMAAVDDLDVAARLEGARMELQHLPVPLAALLAPVCGEQGETVRAQGLVFETALPLDLPAVLGDTAAIRRMVSRLLASAASLAEPNEPVRLEGAQIGDAVVIRVARPHRLAGVAEADLFDPGWQAHGEATDAPLLGLGFSLHLIRRLATACRAQLLVDDSWFTLRLPVAEPVSAIPAEQ